jgi:chromosome segregation ATPase
MTKDDRGDLDLTKQIEIKDKELKTLNDVVTNLKNIIDSKEAEITAYQNKQVALYDEVKRLKVVDEKHQKLNGRLRLELEELKLNKVQAVEDAKKESDELMMKVISKYEKKIKELKDEADEMLEYP